MSILINSLEVDIIDRIARMCTNVIIIIIITMNLNEKRVYIK